MSGKGKGEQLNSSPKRYELIALFQAEEEKAKLLAVMLQEFNLPDPQRLVSRQVFLL